MKQTRLLAALTALLLPIASSALAQDSESPEAGDTGTQMGGSGDMSAGGDASAPAPDTTAGDSAAPSSGGDPAKPISVGLLLGYGIGIDLKGAPNPWGLGFGARGGYNIGQIYLGARFVFYLGGSDKVSNGFGTTVTADYNIWELGIEGGYDFKAGDKLTIRPELGFGVASINADVAGLSASTTKPYFAPGASILYDVSDNIFLGLDARFKLVTSDPTAKAIIFLANGGMRF